MTYMLESAASPVVALADLKDYLRIGLAEDDALLTELISAASDLAERFTGQILTERTVNETMPITGCWQRLSMRPVRAVTAVSGQTTAGAPVALPIEAYAIDIDGNGDGWIRVSMRGEAVKLRTTYSAGIAADAGEVPEAIRHGIIRLAGDYYVRRTSESRDAPGRAEPMPPAAVAALWRPWRRMRLA